MYASGILNLSMQCFLKVRIDCSMFESVAMRSGSSAMRLLSRVSSFLMLSKLIFRLLRVSVSSTSFCSWSILSIRLLILPLDLWLCMLMFRTSIMLWRCVSVSEEYSESLSESSISLSMYISCACTLFSSISSSVSSVSSVSDLELVIFI